MSSLEVCGSPKEGDVADRTSQLVVEALTRAATAGAALPLHGSRTNPGLFPTTTQGKQAAQRCREDGYLQSLDPDSCVITEKGLSYLLRQTSPRQLLEDFVRVLEDREAQVAHLVDLAGKAQANLASLHATASAVLSQIAQPADANGDLKSRMHSLRETHAPTPDLVALLLDHLSRWARTGSAGDCPLPWLFRCLRESVPGLTIGQFHDAVRQAYQAGRLHPQPWAGPLPEMPEPACAVMLGHLVVYYVSLRSS
jgi:hypothetical protein